MRYAIFSDIHGNLEAFKAVSEAYKKENIDKYLCVGDIVGYGANPAECIQQVKQLNCLSVVGNHDVAVYDLEILKNFTDNARIAAEWTHNVLNESDKDYLRSLKYTYTEDDFILSHGSLEKTEDFCYVLNIGDARTSFAFQKNHICFIGHSHRPGIFRKIDEDIEVLDFLNTEIEDFSKYLINVGSVGQPRDGDNRAAYCVYDTEKKSVEIKRIEYNIKEAADKIIKAGLPNRLADRLYEGR